MVWRRERNEVRRPATLAVGMKEGWELLCCSDGHGLRQEQVHCWGAHK